MSWIDDSRTAVVGLLCLLLALFVARVAAQYVVLIAGPSWLPPLRSWYSGVMPYRVLLPAQLIVCLTLSFMILTVAARLDSGDLARRLGTMFMWASYLYFLFVTFRFLRYIFASAGKRPVFIPIPFHLVLAAFLFVYGSLVE